MWKSKGEFYRLLFTVYCLGFMVYSLPFRASLPALPQRESASLRSKKRPEVERMVKGRKDRADVRPEGLPLPMMRGAEGSSAVLIAKEWYNRIRQI